MASLFIWLLHSHCTRKSTVSIIFQFEHTVYSERLFSIFSLHIIKHILVLVVHCPYREKYFPCHCSHNLGRLFIFCEGDVDNITNVFKKSTPADIGQFNLHLSSQSARHFYLPPNFLGDRRLSHKLSISCSELTGSNNVSLEIDLNAFSSSKNTLQRFSIMECEASRLDFSFLSGFHKLEELIMINLANLAKTNWSRMPALHSLKSFGLSIDEPATYWKETAIDNLPKCPNALEKVSLQLDHFGDGISDTILKNFIDSSGETLTNLNIYTANLTRIPSNLSSFKRLHTFELICKASAKIKVIESNSFNFTVPINVLVIMNCGIEDIELFALLGRPDYI